MRIKVPVVPASIFGMVIGSAGLGTAWRWAHQVLGAGCRRRSDHLAFNRRMGGSYHPLHRQMVRRLRPEAPDCLRNLAPAANSPSHHSLVAATVLAPSFLYFEQIDRGRGDGNAASLRQPTSYRRWGPARASAQRAAR
jgi:hypothetical protein